GTPGSWVNCGHSNSRASQYLSSFYFIIYTMMTVGYGDIHPDHMENKEMILSVIIQLMGATLFGFIIAATRRIVQFIAPIQRSTHPTIEINNPNTAPLKQEISEYIADRRLGDGLGARIKRHFRYFYFKTSVFDERLVMKNVPWHLCQEVLSSTHQVALRAAGVLQDEEYPMDIMLKVARLFKPMELDFREEVVQQGDIILQ
ncbi:unnamed protein product, partial [Discosporangium mesarthrocarpum]